MGFYPRLMREFASWFVYVLALDGVVDFSRNCHCHRRQSTMTMTREMTAADAPLAIVVQAMPPKQMRFLTSEM